MPIAAQAQESIIEIADLYKECCDLGLRIVPDDRFSIGNIVNLLASANEDEGLRYFSPKSASTPEPSWTRDVLEELMKVVEPHVDAARHRDGLTDAAVRFQFILGRPQDTNSKSKT